MWDIEEDWSEDESFGLANRPGPKRKKLEGPGEDGRVHASLRSKSGSESAGGDENLSANAHEASVSRAAERLDRRWSDSRAKRAPEAVQGSDLKMDGQDCRDDKSPQPALGGPLSPEMGESLSFEQAYDTFGLSSADGFPRATGRRRSSKLFESVPSVERTQRGVIRFSGVSDPSRTFYVETWESGDTLEILREMERRGSRLPGGGGGGRQVSEMLELESEVTARMGVGAEPGQAGAPRTYTSRPMLTAKYVPRTCLDLVNDEGSIRSILRWIKGWDGFVFGSSGSGRGREAPEIPVLLVGGPSGSGKTSMVRILARQCGYEVNEVKVSDERTRESFENSVKMGISFGVIGGSRRPGLILIDELDSLSNCGGLRRSDCFDFLVRLIDSHSRTREAVSRPIVCICNDIHDRSLRSLRSRATSIVVPLPPREKVFKRLSYVCRSEGLRLEDDEILNELIKVHNCDIRSCLNSIYLMSQKEAEEGGGGTRACVQIYWEDFEGCCYTKDVDQDISGFIKACFGLEAEVSKDEVFRYVIEHGDECLANFGSNLAGLLTENIYRCNLIGDFYYDYLRLILDSVVEHSIVSSRTSSLLPFLASATLVSRRIAGLHCNQFRHLGASTFQYSQAVSSSMSSIYRDISSLTMDALKVETMTTTFRVYTLPSMLTHFSGVGLLKHLSQWKSTNIFPRFRSFLGLQTGSLGPEELEPLSVLQNLVSKMVCFGFRFEDQTKPPLLNNKSHGDSQTPHLLRPNIESLYSFPCLMSSISSGYVRSPSVLGQSSGIHIFDIGFYTLVNQLVDFFRDDVAKQVVPGIHYLRSETSCRQNGRREDHDLPQKQVPSSCLAPPPSFQDLVSRMRDGPQVRPERPSLLCIYRYNDGSTNAVRMEIHVSDFFV
ncbi:RF-C (Ctf18p) AAA+ ATPase-like protein [Cryptosporidium canis]|uniref:RF-C (Ctf18p) AAA+ ATPase-like protein n=1 Tax=Cryptosporidium canis TaxID=195482 RepID=A0A9D5HZ95_9CRYT|nr:RF-C (Ctf18p) AAA+ ATPase-like protein [Cryptosporidium canis]